MGGVTGKIQRVESYRATITPEPLELTAEIAQVGQITGKVQKVPGFSGVMFLKRTYSAVIEAAQAAYRFLKARSKIIAGHKATADAAPGAEIKADRITASRVAAEVCAHDAEEMQATRKVGVSVLSRLVAYNRAAVVHLAKIITGKKAEATTAEGISASYHETAILERTYNAEAAPGKKAGCKREIQLSVVSTGSAASAVAGGASRYTCTETQAQAGAAETQALAVDMNADTVECSAMAVFWIYPEVVDGVLILRQAYSATQTDDVLEVV